MSADKETYVFLTDGKTFIGPYSREEPLAIHRGTRTLHDVHGAIDVWAVNADTDEEARRLFAAIPASERRRPTA